MRRSLLVRNLFVTYCAATSGAAALWAAIGTPVLVGGAALSVDTSRMYNMDHDLQAASDALARAGAAELDQRSDSLQRAARAVNNLVRNDQKFGDNGGTPVVVDRLRYLKSIPDKDYQDFSPDQITINPAEARYVEVSVRPESISTLFPPSLVRGIAKVELSAKSVAGFDQEICGVAPVFICNPFEGEDKSIYEAVNDPAFRRRQIKFVTQSGHNKQYSPGNFGWLDPFAGAGGANAIRDAVAIDRPDICMSKSRGVHLRPGNIASMRFGINTRFDMYDGPFKSKRTDPAYAPAANVVKGTIATRRGRRVDVCSPVNNDYAQALPRDNCHNDSTCARVGDGDWDFVRYMKVNHNYMRQITLEGVTYRIDYKNHRSYPAEPPSRYALYRWEIETNCVPGKLTYGRYASTPEEGRPQCHAYGPSTNVEDRRVIHAAVLNCGEIEESGESMSGRTDALPVETFVKVFLTEPMGSGKDNTLFGEVTGLVVQGQDQVSRDQVALSR